MRWNVLFLELLLLLLVGGVIPCYAEDRPEAPQVKNLILLIGDGMGPQQMGLLTAYANQAPHSIYTDRETALEEAMDRGVIGLIRTSPPGVLVTDSAAAATQ